MVVESRGSSWLLLNSRGWLAFGVGLQWKGGEHLGQCGGQASDRGRFMVVKRAKDLSGELPLLPGSRGVDMIPVELAVASYEYDPSAVYHFIRSQDLVSSIALVSVITLWHST
jgi:hypothetical protein